MPDPDAPIHLVDYDPQWPRLFEEERALLHPILLPWLAGPIEHIGSTAVPGLAAKPVIDIMAAVKTLEESKEAITASVFVILSSLVIRASSFPPLPPSKPTAKPTPTAKLNS
ncbi:MAG: GrpB family protein [Chthoniobacteraceae bacterium]